MGNQQSKLVSFISGKIKNVVLVQLEEKPYCLYQIFISPRYFLCDCSKCNICVAFLKFVIIFVSLSRRYIKSNKKKILLTGKRFYRMVTVYTLKYILEYIFYILTKTSRIVTQN